MKNKGSLILLLAAALLTTITTTAISAADKAKEKERIKYRDNRIKTVTEYSVNPATKESKKKTVQKINADGYRNEIIEYTDSGEIDKRIEYKFDPATSREVSFSEYSVNGKLRANCDFKYDTGGNLIEEINKNQRDVVTKTVIYKYSGPNPSEQLTYNISNKVTGRCQYTFNDKGFKTSIIIFDEKNSVSSKWEYKYGSDENLVESLMRDGFEKLRAKWEYKYDKKGLLSETAGADAAGKIYSIKKIEYEFAPSTQEIAAAASKMAGASEATGFTIGQFVNPAMLNQSAEQCTPEEFVRLMEAGKITDFNYQDSGGWTPLISAAEFGNLALVKFLLEKGADPKITDKKGKNALDHAKGCYNKEVIMELKKVTKQ